jgi:NAD(P)-dependent dehydrogenase (short-subunit alcohol dehydrogenase family)
MKEIAITGGARGIGLATAEELLRRGHRIVLGDLDGDLAQAKAAQLGPEASGGPLDVRETAAFAAFLDAAEERAGAIDVLINNAGIMPIGPFLDESTATADQIVDVNLRGVLTGSKLALDRMVPRGSGHLINVSSQAGRVAPPAPRPTAPPRPP